MKYDITEIGSDIKRLREGRYLSYQQLSDLIGITSATIFKWEQGSNEPRLINIIAICDVLDVDILDLVKPIQDSRTKEA